MKLRFYQLPIAFALASLASLTSSEAQDEEIRRYRTEPNTTIEFDIDESKDPLYPINLKREGIDEGVVRYAIFVNQYGELADYLLLEATHLDFAEAVERVLPKWKYSVPVLNGETAAVVSRVTVKFKQGHGVVYETSGYENLQMQFRSIFDPYRSYRTYSLWELDGIPIPNHIEKPSFHTDLLEERELVNAVFEFYIDEDGKVRMPTLREADDKVDVRLLIIAQEALLQWRFDPPKRNGRPVVVKVAQPFRFKKVDSAGVIE